MNTPDLGPAEAIYGTGKNPGSTAIYNIIKSTLEFPTDETEPLAKGTKLANDIAWIWQSADKDLFQMSTWYVWKVLLDVVQCVPSEHPWQTLLVEAVVNLSRREGTISDRYEHPERVLFQDLPDLGMALLESWQEPRYVNGYDSPQFLQGYRNLNSFLAHLSLLVDRIPWTRFAIDQLRIALEEEPDELADAAAVECKLWVATEWIIHGAETLRWLIRDFEHSGEELDDDGENRTFRKGPLVPECKSLGSDRWNFWKKRFAEIASGNGGELDAATIERVKTAWEIMESEETRYAQ
ncbi:hypothetical protein QBC35DRAFT_510256 [Podospora australis]|uniref:Uncharacterized protein n=1 Tax=Podospora australis TaxID=1536484 RepID=A0AAN7ADR8_9PEZI|nr:hypothetical protein QBC35DRAFT_510256 [Podospora australis]